MFNCLLDHSKINIHPKISAAEILSLVHSGKVNAEYFSYLKEVSELTDKQLAGIFEVNVKT